MPTPKNKSGGSTKMDVNVARELGRMTEMLDRGREDRIEMKESQTRLHDGLEGLRRSMDGLQQTMSATATQVANISLERCGTRLSHIEGILEDPEFKSRASRIAAMERTIDRYEKWIGTGWQLVGKIIVGVFSSGTLGAVLVKVFGN